MNQILDIKTRNKKLIKLFKIQFVFSFSLIVMLFFYVLKDLKIKGEEKKISNVVNLNAKLVSIFEEANTEKENNIGSTYFGKLKIEKINLEYYIYNNYSEELLKILPCKFSGKTLNDYGNICIIGHNYFDNRFFGNLDKLKMSDEIIIEDLSGKQYKYRVYEIDEIDEQNINEVIEDQDGLKTITLCTCTFNKERRLVVKAKRNEIESKLE